MKRKILGTVFILTCCVITGFHISTNSSKPEIKLRLENIAALAQSGDAPGVLAKECYDEYESYGKKSRNVRICRTCDFAWVFKPKKNTICPK